MITRQIRCRCGKQYVHMVYGRCGDVVMDLGSLRPHSRQCECGTDLLSTPLATDQLDRRPVQPGLMTVREVTSCPPHRGSTAVYDGQWYVVVGRDSEYGAHIYVLQPQASRLAAAELSARVADMRDSVRLLCGCGLSWVWVGDCFLLPDANEVVSQKCLCGEPFSFRAHLDGDASVLWGQLDDWSPVIDQDISGEVWKLYWPKKAVWARESLTDSWFRVLPGDILVSQGAFDGHDYALVRHVRPNQIHLVPGSNLETLKGRALDYLPARTIQGW